MHYGLVVNIQIKSSQNCDRGRIMSDDWTIGGKNLAIILILEIQGKFVKCFKYWISIIKTFLAKPNRQQVQFNTIKNKFRCIKVIQMYKSNFVVEKYLYKIQPSPALTNARNKNILIINLDQCSFIKLNFLLASFYQVKLYKMVVGMTPFYQRLYAKNVASLMDKKRVMSFQVSLALLNFANVCRGK